MNSASAYVCSICIANYNGEDYLADCIASIRSQDGADLIEIIVHDDASTDGSLALLARYPEIIVLQSHTNVGFCIANNRMVAVARAPNVLLLNNDAALMPGAIAALIADAEKARGNVILTLPQYDWRTADLVDRGCLLDPFHVPVPNLDERRREVAMTIGACLWISRALWQEIGGFPEQLGSIAEDVYLCCAARRRGHRVLVTAASGYRHRQGASFGGNRVADGTLSTTYRRRALSERNRLYVLAATAPTPLLVPWLVLHATALTIEGIVVSVVLKRKAWAAIYWPALRFLPASWNEIRRLRARPRANARPSLLRYLAMYVAMPRKLQLFLRHGMPRLR